MYTAAQRTVDLFNDFVGYVDADQPDMVYEYYAPMIVDLVVAMRQLEEIKSC